MVQIRMWCLRPYLEGCSPLPPSSPTRRPWDRGKGGGLGKELMSSSLSVLLFWGPTGPSLTLASAPLTREHRGPPIPAWHWLPCWSRSTGAPDDTAAQGWEVGPQLGARCLRSPSTCSPVRDTVCASFCREYLNTCSSTRKMYQPMMSSSAEAAATAAMVPKVGGWSRARVRPGLRVSESAAGRNAAARVAAP